MTAAPKVLIPADALTEDSVDTKEVIGLLSGRRTIATAKWKMSC